MGECANKINYCAKNVNFKFFISNRKAAPILGLDFSIKPDSMQRLQWALHKAKILTF